jgi:hypothetical protein
VSGHIPITHTSIVESDWEHQVQTSGGEVYQLEVDDYSVSYFLFHVLAVAEHHVFAFSVVWFFFFICFLLLLLLLLSYLDLSGSHVNYDSL